MDNRRIGVFDSGVGGLTVVAEISKQLPNEEVVYFGDTARAPYGSRHEDTITFFSKQIVRFLQTQNVKVIVVACNTATITSLEHIKKEFGSHILGVVEPGVISALETTKSKIGIIGTQATIKSKAYEKIIRNKRQDIEIFTKACPLLVQLIEEGLIDNEIADMTCKHYVEPLIKNGIDTLFLACTHFPIHKKSILKATNEKVTIIDPAIKTIQSLKILLEKENMLRLETNKPINELYVSGSSLNFKKIYKAINKEECVVKTVEIENY
jgi:glutamate racemase